MTIWVEANSQLLFPSLHMLCRLQLEISTRVFPHKRISKVILILLVCHGTHLKPLRLFKIFPSVCKGLGNTISWHMSSVPTVHKRPRLDSKFPLYMLLMSLSYGFFFLKQWILSSSIFLVHDSNYLWHVEYSSCELPFLPVTNTYTPS